MLVASFLAWWYGPGWRQSASKARHRLWRTGEFFSLRLLVRTLFAPYRQISAGAVRGNITVQFRAFIDRTVSRFVGFFVRTIVLIAGVISIIFQAILFIVWLLMWPLLPIFPLILIVLSIGVWP